MLVYRFYKKKLKKSVVDWLKYTEDTFGDILWKWYWEYNALHQTYDIQNLRPICPKCNTSMKLHLDRLQEFASCPRCDNEILEFKKPDQINSLIKDNVPRDLSNINLLDKN